MEMGIGMTGEIGFMGDGLIGPENELLHNLVLEVKPDLVVEVGTRKGGGSTYQISRALKKNNHGMLYTFEIEEEFYNKAVAFYDNEFPRLKPYIKFHLGNALVLLPQVLRKIDRIDICFIDGSIDPAENLCEYLLCKPKIPKGGYLVNHDWHIKKTRLVRPIIASSGEWEPVTIVTDTLSGFAIHKRVKDNHVLLNVKE